ncbi:MAG: hemin uptake protein HemP [Alphaproteobacteria bacterium]
MDIEKKVKAEDGCASGGSVKIAASQMREGQLRLNSRSLFASNREVIIEHEGSDYRLRLTGNGKLILTK